MGALVVSKAPSRTDGAPENSALVTVSPAML
jgi:hypothetical protein